MVGPKFEAAKEAAKNIISPNLELAKSIAQLANPLLLYKEVHNAQELYGNHNIIFGSFSDNLNHGFLDDPLLLLAFLGYRHDLALNRLRFRSSREERRKNPLSPEERAELRNNVQITRRWVGVFSFVFSPLAEAIPEVVRESLADFIIAQFNQTDFRYNITHSPQSVPMTLEGQALVRALCRCPSKAVPLAPASKTLLQKMSGFMGRLFEFNLLPDSPATEALALIENNFKDPSLIQKAENAYQRATIRQQENLSLALALQDRFPDAFDMAVTSSGRLIFVEKPLSPAIVPELDQLRSLRSQIGQTLSKISKLTRYDPRLQGQLSRLEEEEGKTRLTVVSRLAGLAGLSPDSLNSCVEALFSGDRLVLSHRGEQTLSITPPDFYIHTNFMPVIAELAETTFRRNERDYAAKHATRHTPYYNMRLDLMDTYVDRNISALTGQPFSDVVCNRQPWNMLRLQLLDAAYRQKT